MVQVGSTGGETESGIEDTAGGETGGGTESTANSGGGNPLVPDPPVANCDNPLVPCETPFVGTFTDGQLTLALEGVGDGYTGQVTLDAQSYPLEAQAGDTQGDATALSGTFTSGDNRFDFSATLENDTLTFVTGGTTYMLSRVGEGGQDEEGDEERTSTSTSTSVAVPAPQPPQERVTLSFAASSYSRAAPAERDTFALSFEIEPLDNDLYRVTYSEDGALEEEATLDAQGYLRDGEARSDDQLSPWNPGRTEFYGASWEVAREDALWVYRTQINDVTAEAAYDAASGHLTHYIECEESGSCYELLPAPAPGDAPTSP